MNPSSSSIALDDLNRFMEDVLKQLGNAPDLVFRHVDNAIIVYLSGLVDQMRLEREVIEPLSLTTSLDKYVVKTPELRETADFQTMVKSLLSGIVVIARQGGQSVLLANLISVPHRNIEPPQTETILRGPQEGFTEVLETNVALIRRILRSDKLRMKVWHIGTFTQTEVRLIYLDGIAPEQVVNEMASRISAIKIDAVLESNYIEEMVRDHPLSLFPTLQNTERPDIVVGSLLEGKICILTNNTPVALIAPFQFWSAFQSNEDYYLMYSSATFLRLIRTIFILMALLLPSLYVATTTFHPEMLPTSLLLSVAASREGTPFPAMIEALLMEITFEGLREAVLRMPRAISQAVSVVGALVIGQVVVQAGIVSTTMVIVVSVTGIASLTIPRFNMTFSIRILRIFLLILAGSLGLFGVVYGLFLIGIYLTGIRSAGVPYLSPIAPLNVLGMKDFLMRVPHWLMNSQPDKNVKKNTDKLPNPSNLTSELPLDFYNLPLALQKEITSKEGENKP